MSSVNDHDKPQAGALSRRKFFQIGAAAATGLLSGCGAAQQPPTPAPAPTLQPSATLAPTDTPAPPASTDAPATLASTDTPATLAPTDAPVPTAPLATPAPTATLAPAQVRRPEVLKFYPDVPSQVVQTHHAGAWDGEQLSPNVIRQMLDTSITQLTGLNDAREAWASLFDPGERIAIKVNAFSNSVIWTHVPLVTAVTDSLQDAGVPAEQIVVFDYLTRELETAGFQINRDGPGVRCYGTDWDYTKGWKVGKVDTELSNVLLSCNALINMPVLKSHMISGVTFAMKNHYGTIKLPDSLHWGIGAAMAELNALAEIKDRTRLVIGDVLAACLKYKSSWPYWDADYKGDSILMSFDPLAHDVVGLQMLTRLITESGGGTSSITKMATPCIKGGAEWKLGASDPSDMELVELKLG